MGLYQPVELIGHLRLGLYLAVVIAGLLGGCTDRPPADEAATAVLDEAWPEVGGELTADDEAAIYAEVIRTMYRRRGDDIGGVDAPVIYLGTQIDASGSMAATTSQPPRILDRASQQRIEAAMPDFPAELVWLDSGREAPFVEALIPGADNGVTIGLSHIDQRADGAVLVAAGLSFNCNCELGGGAFYVLEFVDGRWQVTGSEGEWES